MKIIVTYHPRSSFGNTEQTFRNVTEIHYMYPTLHPSVAFESNIHMTGQTHFLADIAEFEAVAETEKAESF